MGPMDSVRADRWLWAVRIFPTRSAATEACRGGHVRLNGSPAKPASRLRPGDRVAARSHGQERVLEVVTVIDKRVGAAPAAACFVDHSPPAMRRDDPPFVRERGSGRPTKRDRRQVDRLRR